MAKALAVPAVVLALCALAGELAACYGTVIITKENATLDLTSSAGAVDRTSQFVPFASGSGYSAWDEGKLDDVPIGFTFSFFGQNYTTVDISANGFLSFENIDIATHALMPNVAALAQRPNNFIMCAANDYGFTGAPPAAARLYTQTLGTAPNREFRVQWKNWVAIVEGDPVNVICRLFEGTNIIEVHPIVGSGGTLGNGRIIAGIEDAGGTRAIPSPEGWTQGQYPASAWRWTPKTGPEIEVYRGDGVNMTNNLQHAMEDRAAGVSFTNTYTIANAGDSNLVLSGNVQFLAGAVNCTGQVLTQPALTTLAPGDITTFTVQVTPTSAAAGFFLGTFRIQSNDSSEANFNILVGGNAVASTVPDVHIPPAPGIVLTYDALAGGRLFHEFGRLVTGQTYLFTYTIL
ncbi:MAG: hypothetical protein KJ044_04460, partial [Planctomycetes bacterium]|nr:hypothetical protein [Planctomycetota bacterium]